MFDENEKDISEMTEEEIKEEIDEKVSRACSLTSLILMNYRELKAIRDKFYELSKTDLITKDQIADLAESMDECKDYGDYIREDSKDFLEELID